MESDRQLSLSFKTFTTHPLAPIGRDTHDLLLFDERGACHLIAD